MERLNFILCYLFLSFYPAFSLYADQIGKFDWLQQYIGPVEKIVFDPSSSPSRRVIVSTSQNVLVALSTKSGDILWRHIFESGDVGKIEALVANDQLVTVLTGSLLRTIDIITAAFKQEVNLDIRPTWESIEWKFYAFSKSVESLFRFHMLGKTVEVVEFDTETGEVVSIRNLEISLSKASEPNNIWNSVTTKCVACQDTLYCSNSNTESLYYAKFAKDTQFKEVSWQNLGLNEPFIAGDHNVECVAGLHKHVSLQVGNRKVLVSEDNGHLTKQYSDNSLAYFVTDDVRFSVSQTLQTITLQAFEVSSTVEIPELGFQATLPEESGVVKSLSVYQFQRKHGETFVRALLTCSDDSVHYISSGGIIWSRQESLASIIAVEAIDLPKAGAADSYHDQLSYEAGIISSFVHRIKTQILQLSNVRHLAFGSSKDFGTDTVALERDPFNQQKILVVVTKSGKVFGIDNITGKFIWSTFLPSFSPFNDDKSLLLTQRTSAHFPRPPQCALVFKHKATGNGVLFTFNPLNGDHVSGAIVKLPFPIIQASLIQQHDSHYIKPILLISASKKVHVYPESGESVILNTKNSLYIYLTSPQTSLITGYSLRNSKPGNLMMTEVWSIDLSKNGVITGIHGKRSTEAIHSPGRVLADRSVLYKYGNPNLIVVTTYGADTLNKNILTVHLVDTITGSILESVSHKRVSGPFHFVHSENWVIYTMYNEKFRRNEITTLELFEGLEQSNATAFSSFGVRSTPPIVEKQAFILPQGIQAASHTTTEKGITTKYILFALNSGNILQVSKWYLDPRRPMTQGGPHEEGLVPYMPEIPLHPQEMINYNQTLPRVKSIYTAPTGLESTCLVFAYGLDVYYTRVFPSKMFDVLKDDFDHYLIIGVLLCLISASFITRKLSQRKALKQAWK